MTSPSGNVRPPADGVEDEIRELRQRVAALEQRGATRLGRMSVKDPDGNDTIYAGPSSTITDAQGRPMWFLAFRRGDGNLVFYVNKVDVTNDGSYRQFWALTDSTGRLIMSDDAFTGVGLARPWIPVIMYPQFSPDPSRIWDYMSLGNAILDPTSAGVEQTIWEGQIPVVSHPRLELFGVWGRANGSVNVTYRVKLNDVTIGSWALDHLETNWHGPYDITSYIDQVWVGVKITAQITNGATGSVAVGLFGMSLRQS